MKKVLLTTTALAFAGSAFAANVSGYLQSAYEKDGEDKGMHTYASINVSGSKTTSRGLTFGGNYQMEQIGDEKAAKYTENTSTVTVTVAGSSATKAIPAADGEYEKGKKANHFISTFVSGSFGKVTMGRQEVASRSNGSASAMAGRGEWMNNNPEDRKKETGAVGYISPKLNGAQFAYTTAFNKNPFRSYAFNYGTKVSGIGLKAGYGSYKASGKDSKASTSFGFKVSKAAFSGSYTQGKKEGGTTKADKYRIFGVGYSAGQVSVGFTQYKTQQSGVKATNLVSASYKIANGFKVYAQMKDDKTKSKKTTLIGTAISF